LLKLVVKLSHRETDVAGRCLPPLNALRAFDIAARMQSFSQAAQELNISPGAVSRHIAQLEAFLGITLFRRDHSGAYLTVDGEDYARVVERALGSLEEATRYAMRPQRTKRLKIKLFPSIAIKWLITRLAEFHGLHPAIEVSITTTPSLVRFDPQTDDFTIQIGNVPQPGVRYDKLIRVDLMPVCAPRILRDTAVREPQDLLRHILLSSVQRPDDWRVWFQQAGVATPDVDRASGADGRFGMWFGNSALAYQAAIDGIGVAMAQTELVRDDLASGRLVVAHDLKVPSGETYYLASPDTTLACAEVLAFRDWILSKGNVSES
jgi:LysR family transcriptional regulator, glycine cleavage system transcriptional activator